MKGLKKLFSASLLCLSFAGFALMPGCSRSMPQPYITGGITDNTDLSAPKEIVSKNIVSFSTAFFIRDKYDDAKTGRCNIRIADNESGEHVLTIWGGACNHELTVDDRVFADVQEIIDRYGLVKMNGISRVTAGLPAEYEPWSLSAVYDSGEKLWFYADGAPEADWTTAFWDSFVALLVGAGYEDMRPPKEAVTIEHFSAAFNIGAEYHSYDLTKCEEELYLEHYAVNMDTQENTLRAFAVITDGLFEGLQEVVTANGMDALHAPEPVYFDLKESKDGFLELYIDYVSGRQIYGEYEASELPAEWPAMQAALVDYLDAYIRENPADVD